MVIAGRGGKEDEIKNKLSSIIEVVILGEVPNDVVSNIYASCDIFITASTKETKGLTVLEATSSGLTVIAPRAGELQDSIANPCTLPADLGYKD